MWLRKLWWRMRRRERNGSAGQTTRRADEVHERAREQDGRVDEAVVRAREVARRASRFTADVERSMRPRGL